MYTNMNTVVPVLKDHHEGRLKSGHSKQVVFHWRYNNMEEAALGTCIEDIALGSLKPGGLPLGWSLKTVTTVVS